MHILKIKNGLLCKMKFNKYFLLLLVLTIIGMMSRVSMLSSIPAEMHRDEIAIGYNAYSVLKTTKDEYGNGPFPLLFESYGDYKLPGLVYAVVPSIFLFGLNEFSVRLPTVLFSVALIPIVYLLMYHLSKNKKLALISAALLTFSIWHTFLSRTAYEPIAGLTLSIAGLLLFFYAEKNKRYYLFSLILLVVSFVFYNISQLLTVPLLLVAMVIYRKSRSMRFDLSFIATITISLIVILLLLSTNTKNRAETTILSAQSRDLEIVNQARLKLHEKGVSPVVSRLLVGPEIHLLKLAAKNYFAAFSPVYLFSTGGSNAWHNLSGIGLGNINPAVGVFFSLGLSQIIKVRNKTSIFLLAYLFLSPVPDAMTIDAPVTNRLLDFHLAILLIASFGVLYLLRRSKTVFVIFCILFTSLYLQFITKYFLLHSQTLNPQWVPGTKEMANAANNSSDNYDKIYIYRDNISPTIYSSILFYSKYDPKKLQNSATWFRGNDFHHAVSFPPYELTSSTLEDVEILATASAERSLYVVRRNEGFAEIVIGQILNN